MHSSIRPSRSDLDDDLEELQRNFFATQQKPSASVVRAAPPLLEKTAPKQDTPKKESVFAQRRREAQEKTLATAPPTQTTQTTQTITRDQETSEFEPVQDPFQAPHVPVTKKMLDLTSMLGSVLGQVKEHTVETVVAPSMPTEKPVGLSSSGHTQGFPQPARLSRFKKNIMASTVDPRETRVEVEVETKVETEKGSMEMDENTRRIEAMTEEEIEEARQEIMGVLSPESIAMLMKKKPTQKKKVQWAQDEEQIAMKETYFKDVPLEKDKLAWMNTSPLPIKQDKAKQDESVYTQLRFDLKGCLVNQEEEIPQHLGLHHHGADPDKAGYTLAELLHLMRSHVPSQRSMVLTTVARIIQHTKYTLCHSSAPWAQQVLETFVRPDLAIPIYLRSALDDNHLVVQISAIKSIAALLLDSDEEEEKENMEVFMGHIFHPREPEHKEEQVTGLFTRFATTVNALKQAAQTKEEEEEEEEESKDAKLAHKDLVRGFISMDILARIRYLIAPSSALLEDTQSMDLLFRILLRLAQAGRDVCTAIMEYDLLDRALAWGVYEAEWPMTQASVHLPSTTVLRLLRVMAQGDKKIAKTLITMIQPTLQYLVVSPQASCAERQSHAYLLQQEMLRLLRVLICYGLVMPTLQDLQDPLTDWLRAALKTPKARDADRASASLCLLEVLLHAAADPHKITPAHAIPWAQPTAFLPMVVSLLSAASSQVQDSALGYLAAWASFIDRFPPPESVVRHVWEALSSIDWSQTQGERTLRHVQLLSAYKSLRSPCYKDLVGLAQQEMLSVSVVQGLSFLETGPQNTKSPHNSHSTACSRAFMVWLSSTEAPVRKQVWPDYHMAEIKTAVCSVHAGAAETWPAQSLIQSCVLDRLGSLASSVDAFYGVDHDTSVSKALFEYDGRCIETLMYAKGHQTTLSVFLWSPIDEMYHGDKTSIPYTQPAQVVAAALEAAQLDPCPDPAIVIVSLMKVFLVGDREGRQHGFESDREVFWEVSESVDRWLDQVCHQPTELRLLEDAWRRSSGYIRQAHVPFYPFYQSFVAQYAAVSMGHRGFARLLAYLATELIQHIDYWHLLISDYRDILRTLKIQLEQVANPQALLELQKHM
ncbi:hypothetical protein BDF14DRAFT_1788530 [Spinellus fusiger]|nr:hypothetical protein BDF14DRAFT_1788530 [Spinellus fusiger]